MVKHLNAYDRALLGINNKLLTMSELVKQHLTAAMSSLADQDAGKAGEVVNNDQIIDAMEEAIEMESLELISLQQPIDQDLRFLAAVMRIGRELERVSDYACDIAESTLDTKEKVPFFKPLIDVPSMAEHVLQMMQKTMKAYAEKNIAIAREIDQDDDAVDQLFVQLLTELTSYLKKSPDYVDQAVSLLLTTRYLERIGDHIVNIAEMVIFIETGERHPFKLKR